jgi:uncharacterized protein (DUF433 family)
MSSPCRPPVIHGDPEILGGTPVFIGTRVPVKSLYDYLEAGDSLDEFLESFPSVSREQAVAALELAREMTEAPTSTPWPSGAVAEWAARHEPDGCTKLDG